MPDDDAKAQPKPKEPVPVAGPSQEELEAKAKADSEANAAKRLASAQKFRDSAAARDKADREEPNEEPEDEAAEAAEVAEETKEEKPAAEKPSEKEQEEQAEAEEEEPEENETGFPTELLKEALDAGLTAEEIASFEDPAALHRALARDEKRLLERWVRLKQAQEKEKAPEKPAEAEPKPAAKPTSEGAPDWEALEEEVGSGLAKMLRAQHEQLAELRKQLAEKPQPKAEPKAEGREWQERRGWIEGRFAKLPKAYAEVFGDGGINDLAVESHIKARAGMWGTAHAVHQMYEDMGESISWDAAFDKALRMDHGDLAVKAGVAAEQETIKKQMRTRKRKFIGKPTGGKAGPQPGSREARVRKVEAWIERLQE